MPLASVACEQEADANGERQIWLAAAVVNRLKALRGAGESYSDVILRLASSGEPSSSAQNPDRAPRRRRSPQ
jgi:hypothetical protein